jgi:putative DNA primase/helicase
MNTSNDIRNVFIPESLKAMTNWCVWKREQRKDRTTKVPYQTNGKRASSTHRETWTSFDDVTKLLAIDDRYAGYGFMLSDDIVFVDVDHCINDGIMDERGADILSAFPLSYAEISQSGQGLHILTRGMIPRSFHNQKNGVEMYSSARFCAITGNAIQQFEPTTEQDGVLYVFNRYKTKDKETTETVTGTSNNTDRWIIAHASSRTGQMGRNFRTLFFNGDTSAYGSASEADSALCTLLAFWCDRDPGQIDHLFRQSGLYRPKWERADYRKRTINHACQHIPESISEYQRRMNREKAKAIAEER